MKVLVSHNVYRQPGGEDAVVAAEIDQLVDHGNSVVRYFRHNDELKGISGVGVLRVAAETVWASESKSDLRCLLADNKPTIAHFHNTFPLISPSAYYACAETGVPVVQTLHNFRLLCPAATLSRNGKVCESCLGTKTAWPGIVRRCYRKSFAQTAALSAMLASHTAMRTWQRKVDIYIALTEFARRKFIQGGLPADRIVVKPNFVSPDPSPKTHVGDYALFVGRLSPEKGIDVLINAWRSLSIQIPLYIAGKGPESEQAETQIKSAGLSNVTLLGEISHAEVVKRMHGARFLVCPSVWYEGFPITVSEAFACGLPVIASGVGSLAEIVMPGRTGLHVTPGDPSELSQAVEWAWTHSDAMQQMGIQARQEFETKYTAKQNYRSLMNIYNHILHVRGKVTTSCGGEDLLAAS